MARKGNQQRNGVVHNAPNHKKKVSDSDFAIPGTKVQGKVSEVKIFPGEEILNGSHPVSHSTDNVRRTYPAEDDSRTRQNSGKFQRKEKQGIDKVQDPRESVSSQFDLGSSPFVEPPGARQVNRTLPVWKSGIKHVRNGVNYLLNGLHIRNTMENVKFSGSVAFRNLRDSAMPMLEAAGDWLERHRPLFAQVTSNLYDACTYVKTKVVQAYPLVSKWLIHFGNIMLLLAMVWLDFTLRGIDSFLRLGTSSFFSVIWCSIISVLAMVGTFKFLIFLAIGASVGVFIGLTLGLLVLAISGIVFLWLYGSFWTTTFIIIIGGLAFMLSHERLALFVTTVYSMYCAWTYVGWLGLLLALNLSFLSCDILIYFLKNNMNQRGGPNPMEQAAGVEGQSGFNSESFHPSFTENGPGLASDRGPGVPSTSGADSELTSEEEVIRLLKCTDHYSVMGLSRYESVDASLLKREYRKKAMLVHPDKNMGNEKAAEAFKKLQNAYEILLDSLKRKAYDDELRREELLNYFRRFQSNSSKNGERGVFASGFAHSEANDPFGESRRISCRKCNDFHVWVYTSKQKSRARWCQECKDFHQAKDGDGWVEQSSQPFLFGLLQRVDNPSAYVCADSKIYDATEWYICQGMRCPANTHKPSFHVNTSITSKHNNTSKGSSSGQRSGRVPSSNLEENMTEEEFFEWLQNAVQAGVFDNFSGSTSAESPSAKAGNGPKNTGSGSSNSNKRKKKGKKQW